MGGEFLLKVFTLTPMPQPFAVEHGFDGLKLFFAQRIGEQMNHNLRLYHRSQSPEGSAF